MQSIFYSKAAKHNHEKMFETTHNDENDSELEEGYSMLDLKAESTVNTKGGFAAVKEVVERR